MNIELQDLNVILVEPSVSQQKMITRFLQAQGVSKISYYTEGSNALDAIYRDPPDLVISTLYMADMTGTDLIHSIRLDPELENIVFMLISSETRMQALDPIRQAGAVAILPKPFSETQLRAALYSTLELIDPQELKLEDLVAEELTVLIVDDSRMARKHIRRVLESMGIEKIEEADDGSAAIPMLQENYYDLVVTDYNMPEMDGDKLVEHIRKNSNQASVPVLMVTSEENDVRLAAARQSGVSALADKPFEPGNIRALITQLLSENL
ncbi:MAG: response regulator [Gammaproteobacteria bacterium]|nr:response regulator [Gammaproteobacteria bacterium]